MLLEEVPEAAVEEPPGILTTRQSPQRPLADNCAAPLTVVVGMSTTQLLQVDCANCIIPHPLMSLSITKIASVGQSPRPLRHR